MTLSCFTLQLANKNNFNSESYPNDLEVQSLIPQKQNKYLEVQDLIPRKKNQEYLEVQNLIPRKQKPYLEVQNLIPRKHNLYLEVKNLIPQKQIHNIKSIQSPTAKATKRILTFRIFKFILLLLYEGAIIKLQTEINGIEILSFLRECDKIGSLYFLTSFVQFRISRFNLYLITI